MVWWWLFPSLRIPSWVNCRSVGAPFAVRYTVTEVRTPVTYLRISKFTHSDTIKKNCGDYEFTTLNFGMWISRQVLKGAGEIDDLIN